MRADWASLDSCQPLPAIQNTEIVCICCRIGPHLQHSKQFFVGSHWMCSEVKYISQSSPKFSLLLPISLWGLEISQKRFPATAHYFPYRKFPSYYNWSPDDQDQFSWRQWLLWAVDSMLRSPHKPCPPQALSLRSTGLPLPLVLPTSRQHLDISKISSPGENGCFGQWTLWHYILLRSLPKSHSFQSPPPNL